MCFDLRSFAKYIIVLIVSLPAWAQADVQRVGVVLSEEILPPQVALHEVKEFLLERVASPPKATSASAWTSEAARIRTHLLQDVVFHGWPREWTEAPPKFEEVGVIAGQGYRIRKLRYEIVPGFWSTALLYEPEKLTAKMPAVLSVNGHEMVTGKATEYAQKRSINMARRGILSLHPEWLGCGENYRKENDHSVGAHLDLVGLHEVGLFYLAMRKGLDYLAAHPNVDPTRLGMTGLSGGGWQTIMLSSLDERVRVAVPVAGFSSMNPRIEVRWYGDVGDNEQWPTDFLKGVDFTHLVALRAPRPTLLAYNAEDDCCFRAPIVKPLVFDAMRPLFRLYGAEESLAWHENRDPGTHNYQLDNRLAAYGFFSRHFGMPPITEEIPVDGEVKSIEELAVGVPADNLTILGLARKMARTFERGAIRAGDPEWRAGERKRLAEVVRYHPAHASRVWSISSTKDKGVESRSYMFQMDNRLSATGVWFKAIPVGEDSPATIVLNDGGIKAAAADVSERISRGEQVLAADLVFSGACCPGYEQMTDALGDRAIGLRAAQLVELARWMQSISGRRQSRLETSGIRTQTVALIAAALEPELFSTITVRDGMSSFSYLLDKPVSSWSAPELFCLDLFKYFDLDRLAAIAAPTQVASVR